MQMAEEPSQPYFQSPQPLHYCGECHMLIEYCCYSEQHEKCLQWLERNLPTVYAELVANETIQEPPKIPIQREPVVVVPDFSAFIRDERSATVGSLEELKKFVVKTNK